MVPLKVKYPQGGEKQLIAAVTGREVPPPPALPIDVGAVVCNASTTYAVYQAVQKNKPLIERVVTVTGKGVKEPKNLLTRMGTPISALLEAAIERFLFKIMYSYSILSRNHLYGFFIIIAYLMLTVHDPV